MSEDKALQLKPRQEIAPAAGYVPASPRMRRSGSEGVTVREALQTWHDGLSANTRRAYVRDILALGEWLEIPEAVRIAELRESRPRDPTARSEIEALTLVAVEAALCDLCGVAPSVALKQLLEWRNEMRRPVPINPDDPESGTRPLMSAAAVNRYVASVNSALAALQRSDLGPGRLNVPIVKITPGERRRDQSGPGTGDVQSVLRHVARGDDPLHASRDMALLLLAAQRGLRRAEIAALTVSDVDLASSTIRVVRKGYSERVPISLSGAALAALEQWLAMRAEIVDPKRGAVFVGIGNRSRGQAMTPAAIYEAIRRSGARVTGEVWSPHRLRHTAITDTYQKTGGDLMQAQLAAGHASLNTTTAYLDNQKEIEQRAVAATAGTYTLPKLESREDE